MKKTLLKAARAALAAGVVLTAALTVAPLTAAQANDDSDLSQVIDPNQSQGTGQVVRSDGHLDFGATLNTGEWVAQIHDDTETPAYWRRFEDVVVQVTDEAKLPIPEDAQYEFLGVEPGREVWVIPQVRKPGVVWLGWNTQEPAVLENLKLGMTLTVHGVQGPGNVTVYVQAGNFGTPDPLWSTHEAFPQQSWIELNTHTHANWVFDAPGVYLVELELSGELNDGTAVSTRDVLRFAVGDETETDAAFAASYQSDAGSEAGSEDNSEAASGNTSDAQSPDGAAGTTNGAINTLIWAVLGVLVLTVVIAAIVIAIARKKAAQRARELAWKRSAEAAAEASAETTAETRGETK